jgi:hypothetical protein
VRRCDPRLKIVAASELVVESLGAARPRQADYERAGVRIRRRGDRPDDALASVAMAGHLSRSRRLYRSEVFPDYGSTHALNEDLAAALAT